MFLETVRAITRRHPLLRPDCSGTCGRRNDSSGDLLRWLFAAEGTRLPSSDTNVLPVCPMRLIVAQVSVRVDFDDRSHLSITCERGFSGNRI